jgi:hypothetical protein
MKKNVIAVVIFFGISFMFMHYDKKGELYSMKTKQHVQDEVFW